MKRLRYRLTCIITLVVVSIGSIFSPVLTLRSQATGGVIEIPLLIELLAALAESCAVIYMGVEASNIDRDTYAEEILGYCYTEEGYEALLDIVIKPASSKDMQTVREHFREVTGMSGGSNQKPDPNKVNEILKIAMAGVLVPSAIVFISKFWANRTSSSSGSAIGAAINEAAEQDVYFKNPLLPDNVYIGLNHGLIPGLSEMDGYDDSLAHVQYYSTTLNAYAAVQSLYFVDDNYASGYYKYNAPCVNDWRVYAGYYSYSYKSSTGDLSSLSVVYYPAYRYSAAGVGYYENGLTDKMMDINNLDYSLYLAPTNTQPVIWNLSTPYMLVYPSGCVQKENSYDVVQPSGVYTDTGSLSSVKPIVDGMDISDLVDAIGKAIADAHPDEAPVLTPEAVAAILAGVAGVYDDAVTNYYNDTSYIDQSQYITNITNVYEQAIAGNPVIDLPETDTGILSAIKAIPGQIAKVLADVFVPDIGLYSAYFLDIKTQFDFVDRFYLFGKNIVMKLFDIDPEVPKIIINFSLAESDINYGGQSYALDMSWYERFKPLVDNIIVSFSWLVFSYWILHNLPGIISGTVLSRKDYAEVKEVGNSLYHGKATLSKTRVKDIRSIR